MLPGKGNFNSLFVCLYKFFTQVFIFNALLNTFHSLSRASVMKFINIIFIHQIRAFNYYYYNYYK